MMCHFKRLPYLAWVERHYWSRLSCTSYFVHEAYQDVLSYILIDGINIFLSPRCTSNRRMWTCLASVVKFDLSVISSEHWFGYDLWWTCSSNAAGDLSSLRYWFWKRGGGGSWVEAPAAPHHHSQQPLWHPATHSGRWTPALRGACQDYQKEEKERLRVKGKKTKKKKTLSEWMCKREIKW